MSAADFTSCGQPKRTFSAEVSANTASVSVEHLLKAMALHGEAANVRKLLQDDGRPTAEAGLRRRAAGHGQHHWHGRPSQSDQVSQSRSWILTCS